MNDIGHMNTSDSTKLNIWSPLPSYSQLLVPRWHPSTRQMHSQFGTSHRCAGNLHDQSRYFVACHGICVVKAFKYFWSQAVTGVSREVARSVYETQGGLPDPLVRNNAFFSFLPCSHHVLRIWENAIDLAVVPILTLLLLPLAAALRHPSSTLRPQAYTRRLLHVYVCFDQILPKFQVSGFTAPPNIKLAGANIPLWPAWYIISVRLKSARR